MREISICIECVSDRVDRVGEVDRIAVICLPSLFAICLARINAI